jgi:3-methylcrotonyl-CoA carboxylase alpha subunit
MRIGLRNDERHLTLEVQREGDAYRVREGAADRLVRADFVDEQNLVLEVDGERHRVAVARNGDVFFVTVAGDVYTLTREQPGGGAAQVEAVASPEIVAPMPGKVIQVMVAAGDRVERGDTILILEAMKMENRLTAEAAGTVETVKVAAGDLVDGGQVLVTVAYDSE